MKKYIISMLAMTVLYTGCEKDNFKPDIPKNVYVAGNKWTTNWFNQSDAVVWNNGKSTMLRENGHANSVYVVGDDVYVAGQVAGIATFWKNGKAQNLTDGTGYADANSIFVSGSEVYVAGFEDIANGDFHTETVKLWKNSIEQKIGEVINYGQAKSVFVSGSNVYVVGYVIRDDKYVAVLWKNGEEELLGFGMNFNSVFVSNNDVYIAGEDISQEYGVVSLWKNGKIQHLTSEETYGHGYSVYASGNDVYVAGSERNEGAGSGYRNVAKVWKNGVAQNLTDGTQDAYAYSVYVTGNDVYVAGEQEGVAKLWINGKVYNLNERTKRHSAEAFSVFVKK